jgi:hypothetical protein
MNPNAATYTFTLASRRFYYGGGGGSVEAGGPGKH